MDAEDAPQQDDAVEAQARLFDLDDDAPIPFGLTTRARRAVAPESLPTLRVVPEDDPADEASPPAGALRPAGSVIELPDGSALELVERGQDWSSRVDDVRDTRRARARAMARAGVDVATIADDLEAAPDLVAGWVADVARPRRAVRSVPRPPRRARPRGAQPEPPAPAEESAAALRALASSEVAAARADGRFAVGLALVAVHAEVTDHAVVLAMDDAGLAADLTRWLLDELGADPGRIRAVVRRRLDEHGDAAVAAFVDRSGLARSRVNVSTVRRQARPLDVLIRVADPAVAARVRGWRGAVETLLREMPSPSTDDADSVWAG